MTATDTPVSAASRRERHGPSLLGAVLVAAGVLWLTHEIRGAVRTDVVVVTLLAACGAVLVLSATARPRVGAIFVGAVLAVVLLGMGPPGSLQVIGESTVDVDSVDDLERSYQHGIGSVRLDLADVDDLGGRSVSVDSGIGEVRVVVPSGVDVDVDAVVGVGELRVDGELIADGVGIRRMTEITAADDDPAAEAFELRVAVGIGDVEVVVE